MRIRPTLCAIITTLMLSACGSDDTALIAKSDSPEHRVAAWNLQTFGQSESQDEAKLAAIAEVIHRYDLVFLQEIRDASGQAPQLSLIHI